MIQTGNIGEGVFKGRSDKARFVSPATFDRLRCTEIFEGDCFVSRLPDPVGRACILPATGERMITAVDCTIIRFKQDLLVPRYFVYYSQSTNYLRSIAAECTGTTRSRISRNNLGSTPIPVPPLPEQQRIVALLDEAFAGLATAKANAERNLQNARAVFESHLAVIFSQSGDGWAEMSLEDVADPSCTLSYGIVQPGDDFLGGLPIVRPTNLGEKVICLDGLKRIDPRLAEGYRRTTLHGGELLLCVRGSTGVASIAAPELKGANVTRGIVPIRFNANLVLPELGYFLMKSEHVQGQIRGKTYGAALMQVNIRDLRAVTLLVPPLKEQSFIATRLNELEAETQHLTHLYERKLAALEELKKSLLQQAFNGEL